VGNETQVEKTVEVLDVVKYCTFTGQRQDGFGLMDYNARFYSSYVKKKSGPVNKQLEIGYSR
jgi:hypothetical protein